MNEYKTGAVRDTGGKGRMDLLPMCALLRVSKHMEDAVAPDPETGKPHYPERNWEKGLPMHSMIDSAMRHLAKYMDGWTDEDHLCAAATNLLMAMWTEEKMPHMQDIPSRMVGKPGSPEVPSEPIVPVEEAFRLAGLKYPPDGVCPCYNEDDKTCYGVKGTAPCHCGGDEAKCDFYPSKRERVLKRRGLISE